MRRVIATLLLFVAATQGQTFEVASIKPSPPNTFYSGMSGGPGTRDPGLFTCEGIDLFSMAVIAFDIPRYRFLGPDWMRNARFNISAKVPEGTSKEQFRLMQQNLLVERFRLRLHHEKKEMQGYDLTVANSGPKVKASEPAPPPKDPDAPPPPGPFKTDKDGFPIIPPDDHRRMLFANDGNHLVQRFPDRTMEQLAENLAGTLGKPVSDATGLKGKYDFSLKWTMNMGRPSADDSGPDIFQALQAQLGLKLKPNKVTADILVVDHIEKTPTDN
ncbi:MAG TPA: TIGR03435 family protein [Bryobacteraceae bacterium]|nr:TIGR03435 family protein [Bryobacteraceae bacterium]